MVTPKKIIPGSELTGALATYYTVPSATRCILRKLTLTNKHATNAITVDLHLIPSGGAAGDANQILDDFPVGPKECRDVTEVVGHVMEAGEFLQAVASAAAEMTIIASGTEIT